MRQLHRSARNYQKCSLGHHDLVTARWLLPAALDLSSRSDLRCEGRTNESERTRNQNEEGMEKCEEKRDRAIEQRGNRDQRGNVGDANGTKVEDPLQDLTIHSDSFEDEDED